MLTTLFTSLLGSIAVQAVTAVVSRQSITTLTTAQINAFTPYTYFASAGYCSPSQTLSWSCGANCEANPSFQPVAAGGDGNAVQYWYVGYDPSLDTVVVVHEGTNPFEILADLTDVDITLGSLDPSLFPGISSDIEVHSGFRNEQAKTASDILSSVQEAVSTYGTNSVTLVGYSLGAALALLDSVFLPLHLPAETTFQTVAYGLPRVGNQAFADYVDANVHLTRINNREDPIPTMPFTSMGYVHPSGEVHIQDSGVWVACPGQDNPSNQCIVGDVPNVLVSNPIDHLGPYNGIMMGC